MKIRGNVIEKDGEEAEAESRERGKIKRERK